VYFVIFQRWVAVFCTSRGNYLGVHPSPTRGVWSVPLVSLVLPQGANTWVYTPLLKHGVGGACRWFLLYYLEGANTWVCTPLPPTGCVEHPLCFSRFTSGGNHLGVQLSPHPQDMWGIFLSVSRVVCQRLLRLTYSFLSCR
jgi:hypothetical protein